MFQFLSLNDSKMDKMDVSSGGPSSTRGRRSGTVAGPWTGPSSGTFESLGNGHTRGRLSVVQGSSGTYPNASELELTEEPFSITDISSGGVARGKCAPAQTATSSIHNEAQALALQACGLEVARKPNPEDPLRLASIANLEVERNAPQDPCHYRVTKERPTRVSSRRYSSGKSPITNARFPLRIGTHPPLIPDPIANEGRTSSFRSSSMDDDGFELPSAFKSSFTNTLYSGSSKLSSTPPTLPISSATSTLHILAVGVAYGGLEDPEHDLNILQTLFKGSEPEKTRFKGISGKGATLETIEQAMGELYREVLGSSGSNLLILLTGEGDKDNRMHLMGGAFITDTDLRRCMWKLQIDCYPNNRTVTIIFDHCRTKPVMPPRVSHVGIEFIWSCSPGQTAAALRFLNVLDIPRSCFLLALIMTSYNYSRDRGDLSTAVDREVCQLLRFLEFVHKISCPCRENKPCPKPYRPQDPDWQRAGNMEPMYDLLDILSEMDIVSKVYGLLMRNKHFCEANGLSNNVTFEPRSSLQAGMTQHNRGSSKPVHAAPNIRSEPRTPSNDDGFLKYPERLLLK
ncbi:unnamed protein product [Rhizoctonia solani]|uniref:Uncharacterized protein n=1 Tax=Rhizoctonia solani TaxID=456999 RepID=A0A8H3GUR9_9AGAM|nr:unnamed protein product [Rhizoctonia solani]CAE6477249.1 unnamed protein product [Rhizoctonia solani]